MYPKHGRIQADVDLKIHTCPKVCMEMCVRIKNTITLLKKEISQLGQRQKIGQSIIFQVSMLIIIYKILYRAIAKCYVVYSIVRWFEI